MRALTQFRGVLTNRACLGNPDSLPFNIWGITQGPLIKSANQGQFCNGKKIWQPGFPVPLKINAFLRFDWFHSFYCFYPFRRLLAQIYHPRAPLSFKQKSPAGTIWASAETSASHVSLVVQKPGLDYSRNISIC